jgi:Fe-Mn family superoxide dismutase
MAFKQPSLDYAHAALEPHLSERQVTIHYDKHTAKYFDTTNKLIKGTIFEKKEKLEDLLSKDGLMKADTALYNNASQAWNHVFYFQGLAPSNKSGKPSDELLAALVDSFGSFEEFKKKFTEAAVSHFASGWCWLVIKDNKLVVKTTPNAGNPLSTDVMVPVMCVDVWEHAYYLQYAYDREEYINSMWNIIDWTEISERYTAAIKA